MSPRTRGAPCRVFIYVRAGYFNAQISDTPSEASEMSVEFGASITSVPYNEGAARYFSEQGIEVPTA